MAIQIEAGNKADVDRTPRGNAVISVKEQMQAWRNADLFSFRSFLS